MRFRAMLMAAVALMALVMPARGQSITNGVIDSFLAGRAAEGAELDKVGDRLKELDDKIEKFNACAEPLRDVGGLKGKIALKAKCGGTSDDGMVKERAKLLAEPEIAGAAAAGMKLRDYVQLKEKLTMYLNGDRNFGDNELKVLAAREKEIAAATHVVVVKADDDTKRGRGGGGGIGGRLGNALGGAIAGQMGAFTSQMMWIYIQSIWSMMYVTGATMFETEYKPGQWTQWEIVSGEKPDEKLLLERALISRSKEGEWWRTKMVNISPEASDTIILEALFERMPEDSFTMKIVRTRAKMPGDAEGQEMPVPENMSVLSMSAYRTRPTAQSLAGATVGTESVKVGSKSYSAKKVKYGQMGGGSMQWWLSDQAPGGVVKVEYKGTEENQTWTWLMIGGGTGAKSELGVK